MKILLIAFVLGFCSISGAEVKSVPPEIMKFVGVWQGQGHYDGETKKCDALLDVEVTDKYPWAPDLKGWWLVVKLKSDCNNYGKSEHYYWIEKNGLLGSSVYKGRESHYQNNIILLTWGAEYNPWPETEVLQSHGDRELLLTINQNSNLHLFRAF